MGDGPPGPSTVPSSGPFRAWIGNLPYDSTEEQLKSVLAPAGPITTVRICYDKDTGQSKGFGFCEFFTSEACSFAVKNLNGVMLGGRQLRIDFSSGGSFHDSHVGPSVAPLGRHSHFDSDFGRSGDSAPYGGGGGDDSSYFGRDSRSTIAPSEATPGLSIHSRTRQSRTVSASRATTHLSTRFPRTGATGMGTSSSVPSSDLNVRIEIARIVESLTVAQLFYILAHMQKLVLQAPESARSLLRRNPALCYAMIHAQLICGLADEKVPQLENLTENSFTGLQELDAERRHWEEIALLTERHREQLAAAAAAASSVPQSQQPLLHAGGSFAGNFLTPPVPLQSSLEGFSRNKRSRPSFHHVPAQPPPPVPSHGSSDSAAFQSTLHMESGTPAGLSVSGKDEPLHPRGAPSTAVPHPHIEVLPPVFVPLNSDHGDDHAGAAARPEFYSVGATRFENSNATPLAGHATPQDKTPAPDRATLPLRQPLPDTSGRPYVYMNDMVAMTGDPPPPGPLGSVSAPPTPQPATDLGSTIVVNEELLQQILANPQVFETLMAVNPLTELNWSEAERNEVQAIRQALQTRSRGP